MAFVKLDCGILRSTIWFDREAREVFLTALLMAEPKEFTEAVPEIATHSLDFTGWSAPAGWYGFVPASGPGIIHSAGVEDEKGYSALERLAAPERESRSQEFDGRRMIRVDGGYLILNYIKYRERDHTSAERSRRYRERKASRVTAITTRVASRSITQAEAEAEAEASRKEEPTSLPADIQGERLLRDSRVAKERRFYEMIRRLSELQPEKDPPDIARDITGYTAKDGRQVRGVVRPEGLTDERLDRSLGDAEWWISDLEGKAANGTA